MEWIKIEDLCDVEILYEEELEMVKGGRGNPPPRKLRSGSPNDLQHRLEIGFGFFNTDHGQSSDDESTDDWLVNPFEGLDC